MSDYYEDKYHEAIECALKYIKDEKNQIAFLQEIDADYDELEILNIAVYCPEFLRDCINKGENLSWIIDEIINENFDKDDITEEMAKIFAEALETYDDFFQAELIGSLLDMTVKWLPDRNPFETGYADFENGCVDKAKSLLPADTVEKLFDIYARGENWYIHQYVHLYAVDDASLAEAMGENHNRYTKEYIEMYPELGEEATQWLIDNEVIDETNRDDYDISPYEYAELCIDMEVWVPAEECRTNAT